MPTFAPDIEALAKSLVEYAARPDDGGDREELWRKIAAAFAAAESRFTRWRTIDSAPKDGTPVLLWLKEKAPRHYPADGICDLLAIGLRQFGEWCIIEAEDCGSMGGEMTGWMDDWQLIRVKPSHWLPLPEAPWNLQPQEPPEAALAEARKSVCDDIEQIMETYRRQEAEGSVDTPGGLEHMGDVWRQLENWDDELRAARK